MLPTDLTGIKVESRHAAIWGLLQQGLWRVEGPLHREELDLEAEEGMASDHLEQRCICPVASGIGEGGPARQLK